MECVIDWKEVALVGWVVALMSATVSILAIFVLGGRREASSEPLCEVKPTPIPFAESEFNKWFAENKEWFRTCFVKKRWFPVEIWNMMPLPDDHRSTRDSDLIGYTNHEEAVACVREAFRRAVAGKDKVP